MKMQNEGMSPETSLSLEIFERPTCLKVVTATRETEKLDEAKVVFDEILIPDRLIGPRNPKLCEIHSVTCKDVEFLA
jgi:hypothetical protein